jgi:hypothetical protein
LIFQCWDAPIRNITTLLCPNSCPFSAARARHGAVEDGNFGQTSSFTAEDVALRVEGEWRIMDANDHGGLFRCGDDVDFAYRVCERWRLVCVV